MGSPPSKKTELTNPTLKKKEASNGKFYFVLKAGNGQIIGQSQQYKTESGRDNGIASVGKNCAGDTKDLTA
jgi:uncharacterized protein YegP (UPF0339 family)